MRFLLMCLTGLAIHLQAALPDLTVGIKASPAPVSVGQLLTYSLTITNAGVVPATSVQSITLLSNTTFFSASLSQGTFTQQASVVTWNLGTLGSHASATSTVVVFAGATGSLSASVNVTEAEVDANPADNSTNITTTVASATFEPGVPMLLARRSHTATLLPNGKVLVAGGITATGTTSMVELYDPATGTFAAAGDMTIPRAYHTATLLADGRVFLAGNTNAEIYNPATGLSVKTINMITPRTYGHTATLLSNGRVLLAGGYIYFYSSGDTEIFNPVSGTFASGPTLRWSRYYHTATRLSDDSVLIAGGQDYQYWEPFECDIISSNGLSKVTAAPMMPASQAAASLLADGRVLISGGWSTFSDAVIFSPTANAFADTGRAYQRRWRHVSQLLTNGTVLICAGANGGPGSALRTAEVFSPSTGMFSRTIDLLEARDYAAGVALPDGRVLVTGGMASTSTGDVYYASTEIYNPTTAKAPPLALAQDASAAEDSGQIQFQLLLSAPMGVPVSVDYSTTDGSAVAGVDYIASTGTVVFPPGTTNATVNVPLLADADYEPTETFSLNLANATNIFLDVQQLTGSILDDDPKPAVSAQPSSVAEGNAYTNFLTFSVVLNAKSFEPITVDYFTSDGTATAAANYFATNGTLNFDPGVTTQLVTVVTRSDIQAGPDRVFYLNLTNATNASIGATHVPGTILNDDGIAGVVDHFDFGPIASPQHSRVPFPLAITARDAFGQTVTNFSAGVTLWGTLTNVPWQEYKFEEGDFSQWTPLNLGNTPGPYEIDIFDVAGHGIPSRAFRVAANAGAADGISRTVNLQGGVTYYVSVDLAAFNANGGFPNGDASTAHLQMNGVEFGTVNFNIFGQINALQTFRTNLTAVYTAAITGPYTLSLRFDRGFGQAEVWSYADNVRISAANISPAWAAPFTNGMWSGNFQVKSAMQKVALFSEDVPGHFGTSSVFDVGTSANLRILSTNSPSFVRAGSDEVISLTVSNLGPDAATNVLLTNRLSGDLTFRSASPSQGSTLASGVLSIFNLGTIAAGQKATASVTVNPHSLGYFTNTANVVSDLFDGDLTNNLLQSNFLANPVLVHANALSVNEGNSGTNNASMALWLEGTFGETITVGYVITNGTATSGVDYLAAAGNAVFPPNTLTQFVSVPVVGDAVKEPNESVLLNLSPMSTNATLATTQAVLTIVDDDPVPSVTIADVGIVEGNSGTTNAAFQITLSNPSSSVVNLFASTSNGTALAGTDYAATTATVTFPAGSTNQVFNVLVMGDTNNEPNQTFSVTLNNPVNCTISRAVATGTIINDDAVPGLLHHFAWDAIPTPRYKDWPWTVTLRALDHLNNPATNGLGSTLVIARTENGSNTFSITPSNFVSFVNGVKSNVVTISGAATNVYLIADDGFEHVGRSGDFDLLPVTLSLITTSSITEGTPPVPAQVRIPVAFPQSVTVALTSTIPARLMVPASVVIPANQTNASFNLSVVDDGLLNGSAVLSVIASGTNLVSATNVIAVQDNEPANLTLTVPATIAENAGTLVGQGYVTSSAPPSTPVTVLLGSSDTNVVQVPASVIIQSNQSSATFNLTIGNNQRLDGDHTATITTTVANWTNDSKTITVIDDETTNLRISGPVILNEGTAASFSVLLTGTLNTNVTISLASSDTNTLVTQASAVVVAGQTSAGFTVMAPDNALFDGTRAVTLTATAPGFIPAATNASVTDNDLHHFVFSSISSPQQGGVGFGLTIIARDVNDVLMSAWSTNVTLIAVDELSNSVPLLPATAGFVSGKWTGTVTIPTWEFRSVRIIATAPGGRATASGSFDVISPTLSVLNVPGSDLVYSSLTGRFYVNNPNGLTPIYAQKSQVEAPVNIGGLGTRMTPTDDGQFIYLECTNGYLCRFNIASNVVDLFWSSGAPQIEDMAAVPGWPAAVAVSRMNTAISPRSLGTVVYSNGVALPNGAGGNFIEFASSSPRLYIYGNEFCGITAYDVNSNGLTVVKGASWNCYSGNIAGRGGLLFLASGEIFNPDRLIVVGSHSSGPAVGGEVTEGRCYLWQSDFSQSSIVARDLHTLLPIGTTVLPGVTSASGSLIRWGTNGLAFRINGSQLAIVRSQLVPSGQNCDLILRRAGANAVALIGDTYTSTYAISNAGPGMATNVVLTATLPTTASLVSISSANGTGAAISGGASCAIPSLAAGASALVTVTITPARAGPMAFKVGVLSGAPDPNLANNRLTIDVPAKFVTSLDSVIELALPANDLVYDWVHQRICASVPNGNELLGDSIVTFDPLSAFYPSLIPTAVEPGKLAVSDNGQYLYTSISTETAIQRINLNTRAADLKFPTGYNGVNDMEVMPGNAGVVAATVHTTVVIYENGVPRPNVVGPTEYNFPYSLEFGASSNRLYASFPWGFRRINITTTGATLIEDVRDTLIVGYDYDMDFGSGLIYSANRVFDPETKTMVAILPYTGLKIAGPLKGYAYVLTSSGSTATLHVINMQTSGEIKSIPISGVNGSPASFIRWGTDGFAFRTTGGQVFLVRATIADDQDRDGLADSWELAHFGSLTALNGNPGDDPDHDGFSNADEYRLGLDPFAFDAPRLLSCSPRNDGSVQLDALVQTAQSYTLLASVNLVDWVPLQTFTGSNSIVTLIDPDAINFAGRFYRFVPLSGTITPQINIRPGLFIRPEH